MMHSYECPRCGESNDVEQMPFLDEQGRARIRLTCRTLVHEKPFVHEFDDPKVGHGSKFVGKGLVHELDLYTKLEDIVSRLEQPSEYGIVEVLFAAEYPDEFLKLWHEFGHVATHHPKQYTITSYLPRLLGTLGREGAVVYLTCDGTGLWEGSAGISAWADPTRAHGPVMSWESYATAHDLNPNLLPAAKHIPANELPAKSA